MSQRASLFVAEITAVERLSNQRICLIVTVIAHGRLWFGDWLDLYDGGVRISQIQVAEIGLRLNNADSSVMRLVCHDPVLTQARPGQIVRQPLPSSGW